MYSISIVCLPVTAMCLTPSRAHTSAPASLTATSGRRAASTVSATSHNTGDPEVLHSGDCGSPTLKYILGDGPCRNHGRYSLWPNSFCLGTGLCQFSLLLQYQKQYVLLIRLKITKLSSYEVKYLTQICKNNMGCHLEGVPFQ